MILFSGGNIVYCYRDAKNAASSDNWDLNAYESVERLGGYSTTAYFTRLESSVWVPAKPADNQTQFV